MPEASFEFHPYFEVFLSERRGSKPIRVGFNGHESVKHMIESLGIPHTEVDVIFINGESVGFDKKLPNRAQVKIFPKIVDWMDSSVHHLQPEVVGSPNFILDCHLGKLASYMRLLGFDTRYNNEIDDETLEKIANEEKRILLTRDLGLLKRKAIIHGYYVRSKDPKNQVAEVIDRYGLRREAKPFSRCAICNGLLEQTTKSEVYDQLETKTRMYYEDFQKCSDCNQVYWRGSHFDRMERFFSELLGLNVELLYQYE